MLQNIKTSFMKFLLAKQKGSSFFDADILGVTSSFLCLLHCLFLPLLLILQPVLFSFVKDLEAKEWWEWLDFVFLAIGFLAVVLATKKVSKIRKIRFYTAYLLFAIGILLGENWIFLSYVGSIGLVILHLKNYQEHKNCSRI